MLKKLTRISVPNEDVTLWRFMPIENYLSLVTSKTLHFTRASAFDDPWEGEYPDWVMDIMKQYRADDMPSFFAHTAVAKDLMYISCWHQNSNESAAMWKIYGRAECSVAITTTIPRFKESASAPYRKNLWYGKIRYIDYSIVQSGPNKPEEVFFWKRKSFSHEKEVRFVTKLERKDVTKSEDSSEIIRLTDTPTHVGMPVELSKLIDRVYVDPMSKDYLFKSVQEITRQYCGETVAVEKSKLYDRRFY